MYATLPEFARVTLIQMTCYPLGETCNQELRLSDAGVSSRPVTSNVVVRRQWQNLVYNLAY